VLGPIEKDRKRCVLVDYVGVVVLSLSVTGAPCREVNSKVATAPNTQSRR